MLVSVLLRHSHLMVLQFVSSQSRFVRPELLTSVATCAYLGVLLFSQMLVWVFN